MTESKFIPLPAYREYPIEEMVERAKTFREELQRRRPTAPICNLGTSLLSATRM
jgi:hypothetical protein